MAGLGDVFGEGTTANQLLIWGVLNNVLSTLMAPFLQELAELEWDVVANTPLSPEDAAAAAARYMISTDDRDSEAKKSGVDSGRAALLQQLARHAPDVSSVMELFRRGLIEEGGVTDDGPSLRQALGNAGIDNLWIPLLVKLSTAVPTGAEVMNAWLEGQIDRPEAQQRWAEAGMDPTWFQTAYNANGEAPTPVQALELLNRGIIPESGTGPGSVSYEQAFLEGPWRNKWLPAFKALREYLPPPRTVTAMVHEGSLTHDEGLAYLIQQGLTPALAAKYLAPKEKTATATERHLSKTDVLGMLKDGILHADAATDALAKLGYSKHDAAELVSLSNVQVAAAATRSAVSRIRTLYLGGRLTTAEAQRNLVDLKVDAGQARGLLQTWNLETGEHKHELTAAQIEGAAYYGVITWAEAHRRLVVLGYDSDDAWVALEVRNRGVLAPKDRLG